VFVGNRGYSYPFEIQVQDSSLLYLQEGQSTLEEKETDVAISMKLVEVFYQDEADTAVLVTGDTDLAPAVRTASRLFPVKQICFAFPYKRRNTELAKLVSKHFYIRKERYAAHQLPDPMRLPSGRLVSKPRQW
jgi:hypothetical protein